MPFKLGVKSALPCSAWKALYRAWREKHSTVLGVKKHSTVLRVKSTLACSPVKALYRARREKRSRAGREKHPANITIVLSLIK